MHNKFILFSILAIVLVSITSKAQNQKIATNDDAPFVKYAVIFKDKKNSPFSINKPEEFLSQRAIDRRIKSHIKVNESDLPVNYSYINQVTGLGLKFINKSNWNNWVVVKADSGFAKLNQLKALPCVKEVREIFNSKNAKKDFLTTLMNMLEKKDEKYEAGENLNSISVPDYGTSFSQINMLGMDYMHAKGYMGEGMVVAVLDGGFLKVDQLPAFQSIRDNHQILGTWDFVENNSSVYEDLSHGMMVLSTMAGVVNGQLIGTAPKAKYWLFRSEDGNSETLVEEYNWEAAAVVADSVGADVINSSLGYTKFDNDIASHSYADMDGNTTVVTRAADMAASKGILVVNSAGNEGSSGWHYVGAPADGDSVLSIGAVSNDRKIASFSSRGPAYDQRIKPDVCATGEGSVVSGTDGQITKANGTSFSGPIIAGSAASLWSANPSATNMQIYEAIKKSADRASKPDNTYGWGIPNFGYADMLLKKTEADEYFKTQKLSIYPNPVTNSMFYVDYFSLNNGEATLDVADMNGNVIYTAKMNVLSNSMNHFSVVLQSNPAAGVYVVSVRDGKYKFSEKFIRN